MRRYLLPLPAMVAVALVLGQPVAAQEKAEKAEKTEKKEDKAKIATNEEIVIKRKTDKDGKVTIEIKGGEVTVNGKPIDEYEDDNIVIRKRKTLSSTLYATPFRGQSGALSFDGHPELFRESTVPFLGVVTEKDDKGARIEQVTDGSAADKAGLKEGDVITKIDETKIENPDDLTKVVRKHKPDDKIGIAYERDGKSEKTTATLGKRNSQFDFAMPRIDAMPKFNFDWDQNGARAWSYTGRPRIGIKAQDTEDGKGVKVVDVQEESAAEKAGIKEDDIITEFDGKKVSTTDELSAYAHEAQASQKSSIKITFNRNGKSQTVEVKTPRKLKTANL